MMGAHNHCATSDGEEAGSAILFAATLCETLLIDSRSGECRYAASKASNNKYGVYRLCWIE